MNRRTLILLPLMLGAARVAAQPSRTPLTKGTLAITNVNVIPMTSDTVIANATVIVRDGRIETIGTSAARIPSGARRIDGRDKYLIPGLADMHTHLYSDDEVPDSVAPDELAFLLSQGITTIRLMMGTPEQLRLRRDVMAGRVMGPQMWLASPQFMGRDGENAYVVRTADEARAAVRASADSGYDFIKMTVPNTREVYDAVVDEARKRNIRVTGHVDPQIGIARAIEAGQNIEHLDGYFESILADSAPFKGSLSSYGIYRLEHWTSMDYVDERKLAAIAGTTARAGIWSTPTLTIFNAAFGTGFTDQELRSRPDWSMIPPRMRDLFMRSRARYEAPAAKTQRSDARRAKYVKYRNMLAKAIHDSGGKILAGSDSPDLLMAYGWTLHRELESLVRAGFTPYDALVTATRDPAEFLGGSAEWGTIQRGLRADLVLLGGNPLTNIDNTNRIEGVAIAGRWLTRAEMDRIVQRTAKLINGAPPDSMPALTPLR